MHAPRLEPGPVGQLAQDQERAGAGERAAAGVEEEVGPVAPVEVRPAEREVAAHGLGGRPAERDEALLAALAEHAHDALVEVDGRLRRARRLGDAEPGAVQELDERAVAHARAASSRSAASISRSDSAGESVRGSVRARRGSRDRGGRVVRAGAEQDEVAEVRAHGGDPPRDRRGRQAVGAHRRDPGLELLGRRRRRPGSSTDARERREVAAVGVDRARRAAAPRAGAGSSRRRGRGGRSCGWTRFGGAGASCARRRLRARVRAVVDPAQAARVDVAVDLRRRERRVAEQLLDRAQVGAALEEVRRVRVAEAVRVAAAAGAACWCRAAGRARRGRARRSRRARAPAAPSRR